VGVQTLSSPAPPTPASPQLDDWVAAWEDAEAARQRAREEAMAGDGWTVVVRSKVRRARRAAHGAAGQSRSQNRPLQPARLRDGAHAQTSVRRLRRAPTLPQGRKRARDSGGVATVSGGVAHAAAAAAAEGKADKKYEDFYRFQQRDKRRSGAQGDAGARGGGSDLNAGRARGGVRVAADGGPPRPAPTPASPVPLTRPVRARRAAQALRGGPQAHRRAARSAQLQALLSAAPAAAPPEPAPSP
jgi:hypothetical protein